MAETSKFNNFDSVQKPKVSGIRKREIAFKLRIGDILAGKPIIDESTGRFNFLELGNRQIRRVHIIANVIDKFSSEGNRKFGNLTLDDASGQIQIRAFGDDTKQFNEINQGHTLRILGVVRTFNNELYILPEIIKIVDPRYLLVRKLELEKSKENQGQAPEIKKEEVIAVKDKIIGKIKEFEKEEGIDSEKLIMELHAQPDLINQEIRKLLEEGVIYEPRPGRLRYLG